MENAMKVRATLEFDLEWEDGTPVTRREAFIWAAEAAHDAIRARLMGRGFLAGDVLIGTYALDPRVLDGTVGMADEDGGTA